MIECTSNILEVTIYIMESEINDEARHGEDCDV